MTNKFLLNLLGFNPDLTSRQPRVDSLSLVSRQSDLLTYVGRIAAILVLVLTIGVGNAWGADVTSVMDIPDAATASTTSYSATESASWTLTKNCATQSVGTDSGDKYYQIGSGSKNAHTMTWTSASYNGKKIKQVVVYCSTSYSSGATVTVSGTGFSPSSQTISSSSKTAKTFNSSASGGDELTGNLVVTITFGQDRRKNIRMFQIDVKYAGDDCTSLDMSTVTATTDDEEIALSWTAVEHADSYTVACVEKSSGDPAGTGTGSGKTGTSCTITGLTNGTEYTWSVTPVGSGTYCADNDPETGDATPNATYTINYYDATGAHSTTATEGQTLKSVLPASPTSCDAVNYPYFVGWKSGSISGETTIMPTVLTTEVANSTTEANTYYAVWSDVSPVNYSTTYTSNVTLPTSGTNAYEASATISSTEYDAAKLGKSGAGGTSTFNIPSGTTTIYLHAYSWNNEDNTITLSVPSGVTISPSTAVSLPRNSNFSGSSNDYTLDTPNGTQFKEFTLTGVDAVKTVTIASSGRALVFGINAVSSGGGGGGTAHYITTCCSQLGTINGSINMTSSTDGTVTVKDWSEVSYASSYTVKLYQKNGESWDLVAGDAGTKTGITNRSTGATFSGLTYGATYKFKVTAIGTGSYCDGPETAVTSINGNSLTNNEFLNKYSIYIDDGTNSDSGWGHHYIESLSSHTGNVTLNSLTAGATYKFKLTLGRVIWYSANATMTSSNCTNWTFYSNVSENCGMTTGLGGNYIFAINAGTPTVSVTYPSASQAADKIIYWDASIHGDAWSKLCFRVGTSSNSNARETTKESSNLVPGTDQFYKMLTCDFGSMEAWTIANNTGWTGTNSVYRTDDEGNYTVTKSIAYQDYAVVDPITIIPTTSGSAGGSSENDGCTFYTLTKYDGMLAHNISVGSADHGTVVATYTNTSGSTGQTVAEGANADLAHRCIVTITATPDAGYSCTSLTVNEAAFTSGSTHILAADATVAATFTAKTYNITLDREGADNGSTSVTMTYNSATHTAITAPTKSGYDFGGWWTGDNGTGTMVMNASGVLQANVSDYTGDGGIWTKDATCTLYAKWTPVNYTITYHLNDGTNPGGVPTGFTIESAAITLPTPTREGYNFMGWYANEDLSTGGVQTTIAAGSTGNKQYWAKWEIKKYTVTWHVGDATGTTSNVEHGTTFSSIKSDAGQPAHGDAALSACGSTKFIGWVKAGGVWDDEGKTSAWYDTYKAADADEITSDTHYYAMYAEGASTSKTFEFEITSSDFNSTSYAANNNEKTTTATATDASGATMDVKWTSYQIMLQSSAMQWQKKAGYIYNSTDLGTVNSVTITSSAGVYSTFYGTSEQPSSGSAGTGNGYFKTTIDNTATGSMTSYVVNFTKSTTTYSNYRTGCTVTCSRPTPASPTSIGKTGATISWTDPATSGTLDHYEYKVWEDGDDEPVSGTTNGTNLSKALTGLYSGVTYHWKVRRVCSGEDASIWVAGSDFTTTDATLTFSVPTGATAVDPSTTATNLPEADAPTDCGDCWAFVGWTTAAYAESSSAPATLFPAGIKARVSGDATLYAVYKKDEFAMIQTLEGLTENSYYVLTKVMDGGTYDDHEFAMTGAAVGNDLDGYDLTVNGYLPAYGGIFYVINPPVNAIWKFTGTAASGSFYNESVEKYLDLSSTSNPIVQAETDKHLTFTVIDGGEGYVDAFKLTDATTTTNMLYWGATDGDYGVTTESETNSGFLYKRTSCAYTTAPDCPKYEVKWDINNGATTTTDYVTKCDAYLEDLPDNPANTVLDGCIGSGKGRFMGWSPTKVMPAQNAVPTGMFNDVEDAPEITDNVTFYAVFAEEKTGSVAATSKTYTFTSSSWGDDASAWTRGAEGYALVSGRGIQVTSGKSGANATTKSSYDDVTKVTVTYSTNASSGAGSIDIKVNGTSYTGSASVTNTGGTSDRTIDFTPPSSALDGAVKITVSCSTSSVYIKSVQIFYTGSTTTYEGYRTACCDDADLTFGTQASPVTQYTIVREDLASASAGVEIDCNFESNNTSEDITWYSTHRDMNDYVGAYTWTTSQPTDRLEIDLTNKKIIAKETGSWQITIAQAMGSTNYCDETATVNVLVKTVDKFIDAVNGNFSGEAQRLEDTGNGILLPTEAMFSTDNGCADGTTRRLLGWIKASDLATYASGRRVNTIDDLKTGDASNKVIAPGTKVQATGVTWYAVWGVEK